MMALRDACTLRSMATYLQALQTEMRSLLQSIEAKALAESWRPKSNVIKAMDKAAQPYKGDLREVVPLLAQMRKAMSEKDERQVDKTLESINDLLFAFWPEFLGHPLLSDELQDSVTSEDMTDYFHEHMSDFDYDPAKASSWLKRLLGV